MTWHSVQEAAGLIGLNVNSVYALVISRRIGHRRIGVRPGHGKIQISDENIAAYLASCEVPINMEYTLPRRRAAAGAGPRVKIRPDDPPTLRPDGKPMRHL